MVLAFHNNYYIKHVSLSTVYLIGMDKETIASEKCARQNNFVIIVALKCSHKSINTVLLSPKLYSNIKNTH